jgi:hypothetical protein
MAAGGCRTVRVCSAGNSGSRAGTGCGEAGGSPSGIRATGGGAARARRALGWGLMATCLVGRSLGAVGTVIGSSHAVAGRGYPPGGILTSAGVIQKLPAPPLHTCLISSSRARQLAFPQLPRASFGWVSDRASTIEKNRPRLQQAPGSSHRGIEYG